MPKTVTGVEPNHTTTLSICATGRPATLSEGTYSPILDLEGCNPTFNGNVVNWNPMDQGGWQRAAITGKGLTLSCTAKRNYGSTGNDYIAGLMLATGQSCESAAKIEWPNGDIMYIPCVINVKNRGGNTVDLEQIEFDILGDGQPTYVPAS